MALEASVPAGPLHGKHSATTLTIVDEDAVTASREEIHVSTTAAGGDNAAPAPRGEAGDGYPGQIDGGLTAWMQVFAAFLVFFGVFASMNSFGLYAKRYRDVDFPDASLASISLAGSLSPMFMALAGPFAGRMAETVGYRWTLFTHAVVSTLALVLASFATEIWMIALTQGALYGAACSLGINTAPGLVAQWWAKRRSLAIGVAVAGSGVGGLVCVNIIQALLPAIGSPWTLRVIAAGNFAFLAAAAAMARPRLPRFSKMAPAGGSDGDEATKKKRRPLIDISHFKNIRFNLLFAGQALIGFGFLTPIYLMPTYIAEVTPHSPAFAALLLTLFNVASIFGRITMGWLADRIGNVTALALSFVLSGVSILTTWLFAGSNQPLLIVFMCIFGYASGAFFSITPSCIAQLFGVATLPSVAGLLNTSSVIGYLFGTPVATALIMNRVGADPASWAFPSQHYAGAVAFAGFVMFAGGVIVFWLRYAVMDRRFFIKL
ncbi:hypothetical protein H9P43_002366 [Blastocladiella emersonii ATCC 22665]|nr:hypothetical protein H9P43_002366 [Blastocladiella emersonii ATCC 22665]